MATVSGSIQIKATDPSGRLTQIIMQNTTGQFNRSTTPSEQLPMEEKDVVLFQDATLEVWIKSDVASQSLDTTAIFAIPVTQYIADKGRSGSISNPQEIMLTAGDFGFGSADIALNTGVWNIVGSYKVPAGVAIRPGQGSVATLDACKGRVYIDAVKA